MKINRIGDFLWEIPASEKPGMRVPARFYASDVLKTGFGPAVLEQLTNIATLPGILQYALCMPDGHPGYGFPIGGVAAFSVTDGVISPGGIGFDINCGVRLIKTNLRLQAVRPRLKTLLDGLFKAVPTGMGGKNGISLSKRDMPHIMREGAVWAIQKGYGWPQDCDRIEDGGKIGWADPDAVSEQAVERGITQLGTLGSGNHYLEIQTVSDIFDASAAEVLGLSPGQVVVMTHCGSRGFGHQIATDYLRAFGQAQRKYGITLPDRQLAAAPFTSPEGQAYYRAMAAAANFAFANRQVITHHVRAVFSKIFGKNALALGMDIVYDVAHNIAKREKHVVNGKRREVLVHRKGATRAFGPGSAGMPEKYKKIGQPVIIGGSMETGSYLLLGTAGAEAATFGSTLHGAGRVLSRRAAKKRIQGKALLKQMAERGILVRAASLSGLSEEAGAAYKNVAEVVHTVAAAGLSKKVAALKPIGNIKG
ncbi:MAG: RtcB family protein [Nitrospiria bacterium]